jgi:septum formation protein
MRSTSVLSGSTPSEPRSRESDPPVAGQIRLILASASPARLRTLRAAGLRPEVIFSGVDETAAVADQVPHLVAELSRQKAEAVSNKLGRLRRPTVIIGCDSMLELDGRPHGKPATAEAAVRRWRQMSGHSGVLHTGHHLIARMGGETAASSAVAATTVHFAEVTSAEIEAYVATGEPLNVAGAFTIDGLGGAFITGIEGDHHNVVGISLPLLRKLLADLGIAWPHLWR